MELEAKVRLLEKQKTFLEQQAFVAAGIAIIPISDLLTKITSSIKL